jgi:hypothetical protein
MGRLPRSGIRIRDLFTVLRSQLLRAGELRHVKLKCGQAHRAVGAIQGHLVDTHRLLPVAIESVPAACLAGRRRGCERSFARPPRSGYRRCRCTWRAACQAHARRRLHRSGARRTPSRDRPCGIGCARDRPDRGEQCWQGRTANHRMCRGPRRVVRDPARRRAPASPRRRGGRRRGGACCHDRPRHSRYAVGSRDLFDMSRQAAMRFKHSSRRTPSRWTMRSTTVPCPPAFWPGE